MTNLNINRNTRFGLLPTVVLMLAMTAGFASVGRADEPAQPGTAWARRQPPGRQMRSGRHSGPTPGCRLDDPRQRLHRPRGAAEPPAPPLPAGQPGSGQAGLTPQIRERTARPGDPSSPRVPRIPMAVARRLAGPAPLRARRHPPGPHGLPAWDSGLSLLRTMRPHFFRRGP